MNSIEEIKQNEEFNSLEQVINCLRVIKYDIGEFKKLPQLTKNSLIDVLTINKAKFTTKVKGKVTESTVRNYIQKSN
jgi:hypothetical protein